MGPIKLKFTGSASSTYQGYIVNKQLASQFETIRSIVKKLEEKKVLFWGVVPFRLVNTKLCTILQTILVLYTPPLKFTK